MDEKALGKRLQLARRRAGLTQQELCQKADIAYSTLAKIERGAIRSPSVFTVAAISMATDTPLEVLLQMKSGSSPAPAESKKVSKSGVRFVYFDVNGVLVRFFHRAFSEIAKQSHDSADSIETLFWRHNDTASRGLMSMEEFNHTMGEALGLEGFDWPNYYMQNLEVMPGMDELVRWTSDHYHVGLLSNNLPGLMDRMRQDGIIPDAPYTAVVDSSKVGAVKPEPKIFETALQLAAVKPNEILLVDDSRANLVAADRLGWHVMWFDDFRPEESIEKVKTALEF